ncbi:MAG: hypothetical protein MUO26_03005, partial [Methanotrichaceae archaeon]|nr:hypothetical protein [Methanotrichaceae archaeon]
IRDEIRAKGGKGIYHGSILFDGIIYPLINIDIIPPSGDYNIMSLKADVADHNLEHEDKEIVMLIGNITLAITPPKSGNQVGEGKLIINSGQHSGIYHILLDILPPPPEIALMRQNI